MTDVKKLNVDFIHNFIANSYWAKGRTINEVGTCIDNSLNFGIYENDKQIGYARVVTDFVAIAYLLDLFISEEYRNKGYAKRLMDYIMNYQQVKNVKVWRLASRDAQELYKKYGFAPLKNTEKMMEKTN